MGSGLGYDLVFTTAGPIGSTATYRNAVQLVGQEPAGDLFTTIDLWFGPAGLAAGQPLLQMTFDPDFAVTAPVTAVPEPAAVLLMGAGLAVLGVVAHRRRRA